jgi:predicted MFS family arabinose efflux permease
VTLNAKKSKPSGLPPSGRMAVLTDRNARLLVIGQLASQICDRMALIGILWFLASEGGETLIPWYLATGGLPHLMLAWWAGFIINALGALKIVIWADLLRGLAFLAVAGLLEVLPHNTDIIMLFALTLVGNIGGALFNPAILSLPVRLAPPEAYRPNQLSALLSSCVATGNILGPALAAIAYQFGGLNAVLLVGGMAYLIAGFIESGIRLPERKEMEVRQKREPGRAGMALVRHYPLVGSMLALLLAINLCLGPITLFMPIFSTTVFAGGINALAWMQSSMGAGMIVGGLTMASLSLPGSRRVKIGVPVVLTSACYLGFSLAPSLAFACLLLAALGISLSAANVGIIGIFQTTPRESEVPSVMAMVSLISVASMPISMSAMGGLLHLIPANNLAIICATVALLVSLGAPFLPGLNEKNNVDPT